MCCCRGRSFKEVLRISLIIGIPIVIFLAIIGGLLGASAKDLNAVSDVFTSDSYRVVS